jgi:hypothetical protein
LNEHHYLVSYRAQTHRREEAYGSVEIALPSAFARGDAKRIGSFLEEEHPDFKPGSVIITSVFPLEP